MAGGRIIQFTSTGPLTRVTFVPREFYCDTTFLFSYFISPRTVFRHQAALKAVEAILQAHEGARFVTSTLAFEEVLWRLLRLLTLFGVWRGWISHSL